MLRFLFFINLQVAWSKIMKTSAVRSQQVKSIEVNKTKLYFYLEVKKKKKKNQMQKRNFLCFLLMPPSSKYTQIS